MKNVCDSSTPASVRSSSVRARTEPFKSIFMTASPRSHGGGLRVDTAAAAAGCAITRNKSVAPRLRLVALRSTATCRKPFQIGIFDVVSFMVWVKIGIGIRSRHSPFM